MIDLSEKYLMMIEPVGAAGERIIDKWTALAWALLDGAKTRNRFRGFHVCRCGIPSDNAEWILPDGVITNSLLVHYVARHRNEIPVSELAKLERYAPWLPKERTA